MEIRKGAAYQAIIVLVLVVMLFIGMYVTMKPFAVIFSHFTNEGGVAEIYLNQSSCEGAGNNWVSDTCTTLDARAFSVVHKQRRMWLLAPFIFIISIFVWFWIETIKRKDQYYQGGGGL